MVDLISVKPPSTGSTLTTQIEAPTRRNLSKKTSNFPVSLHDLPPEVFASASELPRDFESQAAVQSSISGLQPDMDPHLRQTLEALEDDAYVDDDLDDDFFGELVKDGERDATEGFEFEFREDGCLPMVAMLSGCTKGMVETKQGGRLGSPHSRGSSKGANQLILHSLTASQRKRTPLDRCQSFRPQVIDADDKNLGCIGFSMSSASVFRSDGLRDLDDRFDQIEKEYIESEGSEDEPPNSDDSDSAPVLITSREDFDSLMDDFLHNYEVSGGKMKLSLPGSGSEKLQSLRLAMGRGECVTVEDSDQEGKDDDIYAVIEGTRSQNAGMWRQF
ncbi:hypothetical protein BJV77DRAFT_1063151 [Russula vinacea]|nr:hypothetical protein BJV77DRAFT_1063151 [Russula vinacea]